MWVDKVIIQSVDGTVVELLTHVVVSVVVVVPQTFVLVEMH
jgi:hypothetical protein